MTGSEKISIFSFFSGSGFLDLGFETNGFDIETKKTLNGLGFDRDLSIMKQSRVFYKLLQSVCQINLTEPLDANLVQELFMSCLSRSAGQYLSPKEYGEIIAEG